MLRSESGAGSKGLEQLKPLLPALEGQAGECRQSTPASGVWQISNQFISSLFCG
jgi:hypothetical protein